MVEYVTKNIKTTKVGKEVKYDYYKIPISKR